MKRKSMDTWIKVRLSPEEKEAFSDAADLWGLSLSAWLRLRLREVAERELTAKSRSVAFDKQD